MSHVLMIPACCIRARGWALLQVRSLADIEGKLSGRSGTPSDPSARPSDMSEHIPSSSAVPMGPRRRCSCLAFLCPSGYRRSPGSCPSKREFVDTHKQDSGGAACIPRDRGVIELGGGRPVPVMWDAICLPLIVPELNVVHSAIEIVSSSFPAVVAQVRTW